MAIWDAMFPRGAHPTLRLGIRDLDVEGYLSDLERSMPKHWLLAFRGSIVLVALAPLVMLGRFATVRGLAARERVALFERLGRSGVYLLRQLSVLLKMVGAMLYGSAPEVKRLLLRGAPRAVPAGHGLVALRPSRGA